MNHQTIPATKVATIDTPMSGSVPVAIGVGSVVRIPVPNSGGLAVELSPRGYIPKSGSTSSLFIQDVTGKKHLRLDYGYNKTTNLVEWHWNQKGTNTVFKIQNHQTAGPVSQKIGSGAKYFKYLGRSFLVLGAALDAYSIVVASKPLRRSVIVISAWVAAGAGCKLVGGGGAALGTSVAPGPGTAIGGLAGCAVGGFVGYFVAEKSVGYVYDWAEDTLFTPLPEFAAP